MPLSCAKFKVYSYNVLSTELATREKYSSCSSEDLKAENRMDRLISKLQQKLRSSSIFCLQEVSPKFAKELKAFFDEYRFHFVYAGDDIRGRLGEAIAFSANCFRLICERRDCFDPRCRRWCDLKQRRKLFHFAKLQDRRSGICFCIGSYHALPRHTEMTTMVLLTAIVARDFQIFSHGVDGILAGDFNIKPNTPAYNMLIRGYINQNDPAFPTVCENNLDPKCFFPRLCGPLKSAYRAACCNEPEYTQHGRHNNIITIDYIFCTTGMRVIDAIPVPRINGRDCIPDKTDPSDHFMIGATVMISNCENKTRSR